MSAPAVRSGNRPAAPLYIARTLLGFFGALKLGATIYFGFFASAAAGGDPHGAEWLVGAWSAALAVSFLVGAARLGTDDRMGRFIGGLLLADVAFSTVKLLGYHEQTAIGFLVVDALIFGLVALALRRHAGATAGQ